MNIELAKVFAPNALRPPGGLQMRLHATHVHIEARGFVGPFPEFDFLQNHKKLESISISPRTNDEIDFSTLPSPSNLRLLSITLIEGKGARAIKGLGKINNLDRLELFRMNRFSIDKSDFPQSIGELELRCPYHFNLDSLSDLNIRNLCLLAPKPWPSDCSFFARLHRIEKLMLSYISEMRCLPAFSDKAPLCNVVFDTMRNLSDISALNDVSGLKELTIWGCPSLDFNAILVLNRHPALSKIHCAGVKLASRLRAVFPEHIKIEGSAYFSG